MILNILKEIWQKIKAEFESGPMEVVREVLVPFQTTYDFFIKTVKNIKEAWVLITNGLVHFSLNGFTNKIILTLYCLEK